jgi:hypothetical protein
MHTNPDGFWALAQSGLHVLPGTILVEKRIEGGLTHPILVVAKPTVEHPGTILLRFNAIPTACTRTNEDLEPFWIPVSSPQSDLTSPQNDITASAPGIVEGTGGYASEEKPKEEGPSETEELPEARDYTATDTHLRISHKGIVERRLSNGKHLPVYGNAFWFAYSLLGTCAGDSKQSYTGQPFGLKIRLENLYIARECVMPIDLIRTMWYSFGERFFEELVSPVKMRAIPIEWTEDSPSRDDQRLTKRFEASISDGLRARGRYFREQRLKALKSDPKMKASAMPFEVFEVTPSLWWKVIKEITDLSYISPLPTTRVPTSQEICVAAASNSELAEDIAAVLGIIYEFFRHHSIMELKRRSKDPKARAKTALLCAVIIVQSIADNSPYLAALSDVQESVAKWNPAYLC